MILSKYQTAFLDAVTGTDNNLQALARAGSGKTFIIKQAAKRLPSSLKILFVAFNKHIADALKVDLPPNVEAMTTNAFGWKICRAHVPQLSYKVDGFKATSIFQTLFDMEDRKEKKLFFRQRYVAGRLISLAKANCMTSLDDASIIELADRYSLDAFDEPEFLTRIRVAYDKCLAYHSIMDFDDQIFMPWYLDLPIPQYDVVIVDESQDLNPIQQELLLRAGKRIITVGDDRQAIYGFRGADPKSMANMRDKTNATTLPLSICYRCPKSVVALAATIVPDIEPAPDAAEGVVADIKTEELLSKAQDGDYVLCRTTAPLVGTCLSFIREGRTATVRGRDIGEQLLQLVDRVAKSDYDRIEDFRDRLANYATEERTRLEKGYNSEDRITNLNDRVDTILCLVERCTIVADIKRNIDEIFKKEKTLPDGTVVKFPGVTFCTVHRAKGLEAQRVFILHRELMPHPSAKTDEQKEQEMNLKYVAITRSLSELYWVV